MPNLNIPALGLLLASPTMVLMTAGAPRRPETTLQFATHMRVGNGYGHDGDGCAIAYDMVDNSPVISKIWFDAKNKRLAQTNTGLARIDPTPNTTHFARFDMSPPTEIDLTEAPDAPGGYACQSTPFGPTYCANGSRVCPPKFGGWGQFMTMFTGVLGVFYENTTLLSRNDHNETWQWMSVKNTLINGSYHEITRNYTYTLDAAPQPDGTRPILRFEWTQSIPLEPALPVHRDCFVFDYAMNYAPGPSDPSQWDVPTGVKCFNRTKSEA